MDRELELKVGDIVTIRKDLKVGQNYGNQSLVRDMKEYLGEDVVIIKTNNSPNSFFRISIDNGFWKWSKEMFDIKPKKYTKEEAFMSSQKIKEGMAFQFSCMTEEDLEKLSRYLIEIIPMMVAYELTTRKCFEDN